MVVPPQKLLERPPIRPLTPMQSRFVEEFAAGADAQTAARRAGYGGARRNRDMRRSPAVRAALLARVQDSPVKDDVPGLEPASKPLNARQRRFVEEYLVDANTTAAARRAGYKPQPHGSYGHHLRALPHVAAEIDRRMAERATRLDISKDQVLTAFKKIAFASGEDVIEALRTGFWLADMPMETATALKVTVQPGNEHRPQRLMLSLDRLRALDSLAYYLGLFGRRGIR